MKNSTKNKKRVILTLFLLETEFSELLQQQINLYLAAAGASPAASLAAAIRSSAAFWLA
jgi:hypothetical protein